MFIFRYIMVGNVGTGKTTLLYRLLNDKFIQTSNTTIGLDIVNKNIVLPNNEGKVKLIIHDTSGQDKFKSIVYSILEQNITCSIFVFDVSSRISFNYIKEQLSVSSTLPLCCVLVGTKNDLKRQVSIKEGQNLAFSHKMVDYFDISTKNDSYATIENIFIKSAQTILLQSIPLRQYQESGIVYIHPKKKKDIILEHENSESSRCQCVLI